MCLFQEVTVVEQALVQKIVSTVEEAYLMYICNRTTNSINGTTVDLLTRLQDNYGQLMPHELPECEDIVKKMIYNPRYPIATIFSAVEGLLDIDNITGTSYIQDQAVNIAYVIIHGTGKFGLVIHEWNRMTTVHRTLVKFKQFFRTAHQELRETSNLTVEDFGMHHTNMVHDVVAGLQEVLQQEQVLVDNATVTEAPVDHEAKAVQNTQQQLATQLQKMQAMMQSMKLQYAAAPQGISRLTTSPERRTPKTKL